MGQAFDAVGVNRDAVGCLVHNPIDRRGDALVIGRTVTATVIGRISDTIESSTVIEIVFDAQLLTAHPVSE
ncbi:hypothetical protein D3C79_1017580 [compost metagenome]